MSAPGGGRKFTAQTSREMARRSAETRRLQGLANDPERLADSATADLLRAHRDVLRTLRGKGLSPSQRGELLKLRVTIDQVMLDRTRGRPRAEVPHNQATPEHYAQAVLQAQAQAAACGGDDQDSWLNADNAGGGSST